MKAKLKDPISRKKLVTTGNLFEEHLIIQLESIIKFTLRYFWKMKIHHTKKKKKHLTRHFYTSLKVGTLLSWITEMPNDV